MNSFDEIRRGVRETFEDRVPTLVTQFARLGAEAENRAQALADEFAEYATNPPPGHDVRQEQAAYERQIQQLYREAARHYERADDLRDAGLFSYTDADVSDPEFMRKFGRDWSLAQSEGRVLARSDLGDEYVLYGPDGEPYEDVRDRADEYAEDFEGEG